MQKKYTNLNLRQMQKLADETAISVAAQNVVIGFEGNLGTGKTTFIKNFAKALKISKITSPTFIVMAAHEKSGRRLYHLDLYRLKDESDLTPMGITELLQNPDGIILIEWIDKFPKLKKFCHTIIKFSFGEKPDQRNVVIENR